MSRTLRCDWRWFCGVCAACVCLVAENNNNDDGRLAAVAARRFRTPAALLLPTLRLLSFSLIHAGCRSDALTIIRPAILYSLPYPLMCTNSWMMSCHTLILTLSDSYFFSRPRS